MVRENFTEQLDHLNSQLVEMGQLAQKAINQSILALQNQDVDQALKVIDEDDKINHLEETINEETIWLIAKEQPLASDLRRLVSTLKITTDLERIGDLAVNIAKSVIRIGDEPLVKPLEDIPRMATITQEMVEDVLNAYASEDLVQAQKVADTDDQVDEMYGKIVQELMEMMAKHPEQIAQITQLAFICRFLERVADHTTNISEGIIYLVKGKVYDLND
ncbi:phosphate signaling complex protein PhoU [Alkalibacillus salilacus]|uniref:Phosphate-specific transport system accessory protein PhoU n=1 Tax=Alkalibacillus salilacus TaxID=284582 RepID=A0ABT9VF75_9BACI|nr:phosphate signaling complex protein PhoU [Alkalibacillus salilacus]MDQ0159450.1 phosphate transport system protein [Alkalibacillus salilacus]